MKKQYLVIDLNDAYEYYTVTDDLNSFISEMYEVELSNGELFETVSEWFKDEYKVFEVTGTIEEIN